MEQILSGSQSGLQTESRSRRCTCLHGTFIIPYNKAHHIVVHCSGIVTLPSFPYFDLNDAILIEIPIWIILPLVNGIILKKDSHIK